MVRIKKKGEAGQAKNFITRSRAVRKLQISLRDFVRLCIFKGIYPREPRNKKKASKQSGSSTIFYYTKDIQYLLHEPLVARFREHHAVSKKIARSLGRGEVGDAARLDRRHNGKRLSLDHIIKERYPTFVDALRDLDDALSLLFLFAHLPSTREVDPKTIALCSRLCHEFQHYLIVSHSLRKSFISIKGIYYQATIQGQDILWLVPHKFVQRKTPEVDFKIMATFVDFYTTLLGFVNYRLYTTLGLVYPPKLDTKADEQGGELDAFRLEGRGLNGTSVEDKALTNGNSNGELEEADHNVDQELQRRVDAIAVAAQPDAIDNAQAPSDAVETETPADAIDTFTAAGQGGDLLAQPSADPASAGTLFSQVTVFLARETPRGPLEFLLRAFGCKRVGWDTVLGSGAFTNDESNPTITHQIVDRPPVDPAEQEMGHRDDDDGDEKERPKTFQYGYRVPGRTYVQPQWVWDCINQGRLLRPDLYAPGATMPPHLSPFVKQKPGQYDPTKSLQEQEREGEAEEFEEAEKEAAALENDGVDEDDIEGAESEEDEAERLREEQQGDVMLENGMTVAPSDEEEEDEASEDDADSFGGFDEDEEHENGMDEEARERVLHQAELEAEASGMTTAEVVEKKGLKGILKEPSGGEARKRAERQRIQAEEELERRKGMMPQKKKKLLEKMMYGKRKDENEAEALRLKRRKLERSRS